MESKNAGSLRNRRCTRLRSSIERIRQEPNASYGLQTSAYRERSVYRRNADDCRPRAELDSLAFLVPRLPAFGTGFGAATKRSVALRFHHHARFVVLRNV